MQLSDNEKRDAMKLIQAGKPLPEKYRFLAVSDGQALCRMLSLKDGKNA